MNLKQLIPWWRNKNNATDENHSPVATDSESDSVLRTPIDTRAAGNGNTGLVPDPEPATRPVIQRISADINEDIENLDRLRNRAVIDGVSQVAPEYMMNAIDAYVSIKIASGNILTDFDQQIHEPNSSIKDRQNKVEELKAPSDAYINKFVFSGIQIIMFAFVCLVGVFIIYHTISASTYFQLRSPAVCFMIALGIGCVGISNFFSKSSFLGSDKAENPGLKLTLELIEQLGMPLVSSVLVIVVALQSQSAGLSVTLGLFTFFLSILGGKLLSGAVSQLHEQFVAFRFYNQVKKNRTEEIKRLNELTKTDTEKINLILADKAKADTQYNHNRAEVGRLQAQKDFYRQYYMHYFQLARSYRNHLTPDQASEIQSSVFN